MTFGISETTTCLQDVKQPGPKGEALCLGHKLTVYHFIGPVGLSDDGYVLGVKGTNSYYPLPETKIADLQTSRALPSPMPGYTITVGDYLYGYLLWVLLAISLPVTLAKLWKARRYRALLNAPGPGDLAAPVIKTEGDRFITNQVAPLLRSRERVTHQVFARSNAVEGALITLGGPAHFVALTNERFIMIETRARFRGVRLENRGVESIERSALAGLQLGKDGVLRILLREGKPRRLAIDPRQRQFSNQTAFLRDLPRLFPTAAKQAEVSSTAASV
jgi:hypothetical protein